MDRGKTSALAIISLVLGILSLASFPFYRIHLAIAVTSILLSTGAIITGVFATRRVAVYPLEGRGLAYAGIILGANVLAWVGFNMIHRLFG